MNKSVLLAGFGGQGILFAGKLLAEIGLLLGKEVTWMPSYGPAMRGGTCNCSVCVSDLPIGSPVVLRPDLLIVMNTPSYEKFIGDVKQGGAAFVDSSLVNSKTNSKDDVRVFNVPATTLAAQNDMKGVANIIMLGKLLYETKDLFGRTDDELLEVVRRALTKTVSKKRVHLIDLNIKAIELGYNYKA